MMKKPVGLLAGFTMGLLFALSGVAFAASPWLLLGSAVPVHPRGAPDHWAIEMVCQHGSPSGGIKFTPPGKLTFGQIRDLAIGYKVRDDNTCLPDSPRLLFELDTNGDGMVDEDIVEYLGPPPHLAACSRSWTETGNLMATPDERFNTSQFNRGTWSDDDAHALRLAGKDRVIDILLLVDGGTRDSRQDVLVDSFKVNQFQLDAQTLNP